MQTVKTKQQKLLMLLKIFFIPVLVVVFLFYKFYSSKDKKTEPTATSQNQFNQSLPSPKLENKEKNKLEVYMQAREDSTQQHQKVEQSDKLYYDPLPPEQVFVEDTPATKVKRDLAYQEKRANEQMDKIMKELHPTGPATLKDSNDPATVAATPPTSPEIENLERLMMAMQSDTSGDREMAQLDQMLDKLVRIQNPSAVTYPNKGDTTKSLPVTTIPRSGQSGNSGFYGLEPDPVHPTTKKTAISAIVNEDQIVQNGSTIKLRLLQDIYVEQQKIPANSLIFGICAISDERLNISLDRIAYNNTIFPVKLQVYDVDGLLGISIPGAVTRDAAKQGIDNTFQSLDPSLSAQVATAGIQSVKSLLSRKIRAVRATIKAGHQVLLQ